MKTLPVLLITLFTYFASSSQSVVKELSESDFSIGKSITIESKILGEERILNIYLPSTYSTDSLKTYPLIYLLDGSKDEDFIHITGIVQFASFPWINTLPESIVVGIANIDRMRDFTYPSGNKLDQTEFPESGASEQFIGFLEKEVLPFVENRFRTNNERTIIGQSLGGLLGTEILFKAPHMFDNYILVSPSLWWDDENLLKAEIGNFDSPKKIYIAVGK